ncbi:Type I restriction enzyme EcoKI specificity protein [Pseudomonas putida]|nr:Type I restriction enzyme EcoKI specificity protein [Pseudomonas putida]CAB5528440.1 Type I restriction enzyme EcoKI specificity protein [Pseudomonas putida]CAB5569863.1 Type I restriction enzyme EcoKI specificity protein [Pseudomonas putida]CAB5572611.1 Type I restriction enzyme EcoKI specificity protein [Pseudomonas putida]CAB5655398.1 Type I restriction enzyme EcoKI specificity protein [Pseudomonas putida]
MNKHTAELLEKHFNTAFAAPDGIKKLRELILTLAMQGKLVPQDPNEQPASELLEEIEAEKQRLVKAGTIKKPKPLPPVTEQEKPYALPKEWKWVRFGEIAQHNSGKTLDGGRNTGLPRKYITTSNVYWGRFQFNNVREMLIREDELDKCSARKGDLLICEGGEAGRAAVWELPEEICFQNHVHRARLYKDVNPYFAYRFFEKINASGEINNYRKGVGISNMSSKALASIVFPLPPTSEQRRIIAKIDELMARCDELEKLRTAQHGARLTVHAAAIKQLLNIAEPYQHKRAQAFLAEHFGELYTVKENVAELRKAILQLAVMGKLVPQNPDDQPASELLKEIEAEKQRLVKEGKIKKPKPLPTVTEKEKPYALPQGWEWVKFFTPNTVKSELISAGNCSDENQIAPDSIEKDTGRLLLHRTVAESGATGPNNRFYEGQILYSKIRPSLNKAVVAPYDGLCSADMYPIVCHAHTDFMLKVILSETFLAQVRLAENRVKMPKLNLESLGQILIPLPPLAEQHQIVACIDQLMNLCDSLDQQIDAATCKQAELLSALIRAQSQSNSAARLQSESLSKAQVIDLAAYRASIGCYTLNKLATAQYFGRTAAAKVMYLAQAHIGLDLDLKPEREAAGPLDTWIYDFEQQGQGKHWFEVNEKTLASGRKKTEYCCLPALAEPAAKAEALMTHGQKTEFDRLIYALADKKTEEVEIIATLFAVWNDFLIDGVQPTDTQIISDVRENWHERKARFTPTELGRWLDWLRRENIIPQGLPPRTVQQSRLGFD